MNYRLILLNVFMMAFLVIGGMNLRNLALAYDVTHQPKLVIAMPEPTPKIAASAAAAVPAPEDWTDIPTKNLFSFDRTDITLVAPAPPPPPNLGPKPVLMGTLSLGVDRVAMVAPGQGTSRLFRPMHVGESIDGWTIVEIQEKAMVIGGANNTKATVIMNDPTAQTPRDYTRTSASPSATTMAPAPVPVSTPTPAGPSAKPKTKIIQTPFGPKEVPIDPPPNE